MFKIRPSVGADTTWLSKWPPSAVSLPPPLIQAFTCHGKAETIGWLSRNPTADKEAIANFLQLLSSQRAPENPLESHRRRWKTAADFSGLTQLQLPGVSTLSLSTPLLPWQTQGQPFLWRGDRGQQGHHQHSLCDNCDWWAGGDLSRASPTACKRHKARLPLSLATTACAPCSVSPV